MRVSFELGARPSGLINAVGALIVVALATLLAGGFIHGLHVERLATVFLAAVLLAAMLFGLTYGFLAAGAAWAAYHLLLGLPVLAFDPNSPDNWLLGLFGVGVLITGACTDAVRMRGSRPARAAQRSAQGAGGPVARLMTPPRLERSESGRDFLMKELKRAFVSFCIVGAGLAVAALLRAPVGASAAVLAVLMSVLLGAGLLGSRFGFAAGVFAAMMLDGRAATGPAATLQVQLEAGFHLLIFAALGWGVGWLADQLTVARNRMEILTSTGRDLSRSADETAIRQSLSDGLARLGGGHVELSDETGALASGAPRLPNDLAAEGAGAWRSRRLTAHDRELGEARWRSPGSGADAQAADEMAYALVDLAAAAILRARLGVENAEMEFVARTEHLRTILLDAVSHHFRSPLAGIMGSVTGILNLPEQHDRAVRRELLLIIKEQANRLNRYVDNFLSVARLESGSIDVNPADVVLEPLLYDVWETFGEAGGARRFLRVQVDAAPVRADPSLLNQIFGNVLENAIKFSPEGSVVDVRSRRLGEQLVIDVIDHGPGVPAASHARIFDRFFRSQGAKAPGLGLGLYITRSLVEMLGGSVEAVNRTDGEQGLVVSIALPLAEARR